ncbi:LUD domain-containing protein [Candidatus Shapirobacteria bacterium]|nr:LUD domain-containing protein [Candidatus Shapirobacteria bacterium]
MDQKILDNFKNNGIDASFYETAEELKAQLYKLVPQGSEVMTMTSVTLDALGISQEINESGKYNAVRSKLFAGDSEARYRASVPEYSIGSVHAATEEGQLVIASATGSQLPAYAYGAKMAIFVIGIQKLVPNLDAAFKRIYDYVFPLENERALKAYGSGSGVNKLLVINREVTPSRIKILFINQKLGF